MRCGERNEICRLRHQATIFFECANQTDQDANIRNFIAGPSNSHVNSAAEELGLETMGTAKGRIARRPDNRVANKSFRKTESHAIRGGPPWPLPPHQPAERPHRFGESRPNRFRREDGRSGPEQGNPARGGQHFAKE